MHAQRSAASDPLNLAAALSVSFSDASPYASTSAPFLLILSNLYCLSLFTTVRARHTILKERNSSVAYPNRPTSVPPTASVAARSKGRLEDTHLEDAVTAPPTHMVHLNQEAAATGEKDAARHSIDELNV